MLCHVSSFTVSTMYGMEDFDDEELGSKEEDEGLSLRMVLWIAHFASPSTHCLLPSIQQFGSRGTRQTRPHLQTQHMSLRERADQLLYHHAVLSTRAR
jgi:hypothetical protein